MIPLLSPYEMLTKTVQTRVDRIDEELDRIDLEVENELRFKISTDADFLTTCAEKLEKCREMLEGIKKSELGGLHDAYSDDALEKLVAVGSKARLLEKVMEIEDRNARECDQPDDDKQTDFQLPLEIPNKPTHYFPIDTSRKVDSVAGRQKPLSYIRRPYGCYSLYEKKMELKTV